MPPLKKTSSLLINEHPLQVLPSLAKLIGLPEAIILQQVHYWLLQKNAYQRDGRSWVYNSYTEWQEQFSFWSVPAIKRWVLDLEKRGLLITEQFDLHKGKAYKYYTIDYDRLNGSFESTGVEPATTPSDQNRPMGPDQIRPIPSDQNRPIPSDESDPGVGSKPSGGGIKTVPCYIRTETNTETNTEISIAPASPDASLATRNSPGTEKKSVSVNSVSKDHPGIVCLRSLMNRYPDKSLWPEIAKLLCDGFDSDRVGECYRAWVARGFNKMNFAWLFDWYKNGIPNGNGAARNGGQPTEDIPSWQRHIWAQKGLK